MLSSIHNSEGRSHLGVELLMRTIHRSISMIIVSCLVTISIYTTVSATPLPFAVPKDAPEPDRPAFRAERGAVPDCTTAPTLTITPTYTDTLSGDTTAAPSLVDGYDCVAWQETGPEAVYLLDVVQDLNLHVRLDTDVDLDLFLLTDCDSDSCAAWHASEFLVSLPARDDPYVLVVDGYMGAEGPFDLQLMGYGAGPGDDVCASATPVGCSESPLDYPGNLYELPNRLLSDDCASFLEWGGEQWFAVTLTDSASVTAAISEHLFDAALWLYDDCGDDAECVAFADEDSAEETETISFRNLSGVTHTYYLAVDAFREIESLSSGSFVLTFTCTGQFVANERKSLGDMKAMFR